MAPEKDIKEFPEVHAKLHKPTKQSAFEKQKAEAEAKRQREEAETANVYKDFLKSFDGDDDDVSARDGRNMRSFGGGPRPPLGAPTGPGASKRHFGSSGLKSGPGSLGPAPSGFGKKRSFQDFSRSHRDGGNRDGEKSVSKAFETSDDDEEMGGTVDRAEEKAIAKPTLRLTNLPPSASPSLVKALIPSNLTVENVKIQPPTGPMGSERKSAVAIVTLSQETPKNEIEGAVSTLQNRYLGYGYYLSLHRHLSSAVTSLAAAGSVPFSNADSKPFGAKPVADSRAQQQERRPQPGFQRGFAPPTTYDAPADAVSRSNLLHVPVKPPTDVRVLQIINMVIEGILAHGPQYEALLMSRPEVQRDEKWAWIWDARSSGGIWYRWRLWEVVTGAENARVKGKFVPLFDGSHAWKTPEKRLPFEYTTKLDELVSDSDYDSSDDEDMDGEANEGQPDDEKAFLNPLEKAKLVHLLARLPTSLSKLRKGDIARASAFAITHASRGVEEVVDIIVSNLENPYSLSAANPNHKRETNASIEDTAENAQSEAADTSGASLVALYVVSDILSSSSTSGVRHAWRFRQLFEVALQERKVFEGLGMMADKYQWGRMRTDKWKRSINLVLNLWEGWCVFPAQSHELFVRSFENPPSLKPQTKADEVQKKGKWKVMEPGQTAENGFQRATLPVSTADDEIDGEPIDEEDIAGEPIEEDDIEGEPIAEEDIEGEPIDDNEIEGEPITEVNVEGEPMDEDVAQDQHAAPAVELTEQPIVSKKGQLDDPSSSRASARRPRMRAVDMFADSDESDGA